MDVPSECTIVKVMEYVKWASVQAQEGVVSGSRKRKDKNF
jgi:hypothetical protein